LHDIVTWNEQYAAAMTRGDRHLLAINNVAFIYNMHERTPQLQTLYTQDNNHGTKSCITYVGNYKDLLGAREAGVARVLLPATPTQLPSSGSAMARGARAVAPIDLTKAGSAGGGGSGGPVTQATQAAPWDQGQAAAGSGKARRKRVVRKEEEEEEDEQAFVRELSNLCYLNF